MGKQVKVMGAYYFISTSTYTIPVKSGGTKKLEDNEPGATKSEVMESLGKAAKSTKSGNQKKR